jgi:hypothetical protein
MFQAARSRTTVPTRALVVKSPLAASVFSGAAGGLVVIPAGRARSNHAEVARRLGTAIIAGRYPAGARGGAPAAPAGPLQHGVDRLKSHTV